ncbi:MAG: TldD/PmbA family protein [Lachnospiraceae bacterium]|nr:TldD/PmbA family protein [Lachnospiraceae bacterium]
MNKKNWIEYALANGFESFEIYQESAKTKTVTWYQGKTDSAVTSKVTGTALRGQIGGKMLSYATEETSDDHMEQIIGSMKEQAAVIGSGESGTILAPQETKESGSARTYTLFTNEEIRRALSELEKSILAYDPCIVQAVYLTYEEESFERTIFNSKGLEVTDRGSVQLIAGGAVATRDGDVKNDFRHETVSSFAQFDAAAFAEKLCSEVIKKLGAGPVRSTSCPVIFDREAMTSLFSAFSDIFSGDRVSRGISPLTGKEGSRIFSDMISMIDDPRESAAPFLYNYDDEGHPTCRKYVIREGVFETVLHSTESAARMNTESTGNGFKGGCSAPVRAVPKNFFIVPGDTPLSGLMEYLGNGLVITDLAGLHAGLDHVTGDFSLQCSGYKVTDGKRAENVTLITVAGNYPEMLDNVMAVGNDIEWKTSPAACPSIAFRELSIGGL